jgi:outer membrane protein OmpA-like peptidoglycan-associated protein
MKKTFYCFAALCASAFCLPIVANAQEATEEVVAIEATEVTCDNTVRRYASWRDNWFIQLGAGANHSFVEYGRGLDSDVKTFDSDRITATYNLGFGRWMTPYLGFRINAIGGAMHWDNPTAAYPTNGWTKAKHVNLNFELMWDMFNSLGGVSERRVFSIIPFAGLGGDYTWGIYDRNGNPAVGTEIYGDNGIKTSSWTLPVTAGLQFRFRLCKYADFFAEARATFYGDNWNLSTYGNDIDTNIAAIAGFNINIGGRGWATFNECDYVTQIAALNDQVNDLRANLLECGQKLAACEAQLPCPEPKTIVEECDNTPLMSVVRFTINSAKIRKSEQINVYNMAQWLKDNPDAKIDVVGYADRGTGTSEYNLRLSEKRAQAVADALVNEYGIERDRLNVRCEGSDAQPYDTNDWNRVVVFMQK